MRFKYLPVLIVVAILPALLFFTGWKTSNGNFTEEKKQIAIRKIGHEMLLLSGDSSSRVLPVKQLSEDEYLLQFESRFAFKPDSLLTTIQRIISTYDLPRDYIVNVLDCPGKEVVFGYAMSATSKDSIISCVGRDQPMGCYSIKLSFPPAGNALLYNTLLFGGVILSAAGLFLFGMNRLRKRKISPAPGDIPAEQGNSGGIPIGNYIFYKDQQYLLLNGEKTELTAKEAELLSIFASSQNQIIDRARLQKELWEDEGVIVGRSLDVFVSKLRKKLDKDAAIRIVNIHGKGYKLEVEGNA